MKKSKDLKLQNYPFVNKQSASKLTGLSTETLKRYRLQGKLEKGIHWIAINQRVIKYNISLVLDWIKNYHDNPQKHMKAIENYLASLPSNYKQRQSNRLL